MMMNGWEWGHEHDFILSKKKEKKTGFLFICASKTVMIKNCCKWCEQLATVTICDRKKHIFVS